MYKSLFFFGKKRSNFKKLFIKATNVTRKDSHFLQAFLPAAKGGLSVSSARLIASPAFLASAIEAKATLSEIFDLEHEDWGVIFMDLLQHIKNWRN